MAKAKKAPAVGPKGRALSGIRLVLDVQPDGTKPGAQPLAFLAALEGLTPTQRQRAVSVGRAGALGVRIVLEYPLSETRDIDEAIRDLAAENQARVAHAEKFPA